MLTIYKNEKVLLVPLSDKDSKAFNPKQKISSMIGDIIRMRESSILLILRVRLLAETSLI